MSPSSPARHAAPPETTFQDRVRAKRRPLWTGGLILLVLALVAAGVVWERTHATELSQRAVLTASSTAPGFSTRAVVDSGSASSPGADWQSDGQTVGAWLELAWDKPQELRQVVIVRNAPAQPGATAGFLSFSDGSFLQVQLSSTARETVIPLTPRSVDRLRFTVSAVSAGARSVTLSEIVLNGARSDGDVVADDTADGNEAPDAVVTASTGDAPRALIDGSGVAGAAGAGADWSADHPVGTWVQLDWDAPRELSSIELVGSARSAATMGSGTLVFGDGARLPIGAVLSTPDRPTIVSFMPRVTRSVRLTIDRADGSGPVVLSELRTYRRGATPVRSPSTASQSPSPAGVSCVPPPPGTPETTLVVRCPVTGSSANGKVDLQVAAPSGYSGITATVWPGDEGAPAGNPVQAALDPSGAATVPVDLTAVPTGPVTVKVEAAGDGKDPLTAYFQLYRSGGAADDVASSAAAGGRTLAYAEEFDGPVSLSRSGADTDYSAAKPVYNGAQDFGDAIFTDPSQGIDNVRVVDNRYLRIDVEPTPPGYVDPQGWNRTHFGGLLASARQGGSGFSAQYGYFEARMLMPDAPGTWPAFWMLPSDNLVAPTPAVAEIDALEHYGQHPQDACHSTHQYKSGHDDGTANCGQRFDSDRAALSWHTYGVSITPSDITFNIDGKVVATAPQVEGGGSPMFFLVNLALGGGWPVDLRSVQDRATLYVDYVRVYV